eukprot:TRINITY_DN15020_c1_g1_i1.p1 TRINITY_DN15020_c1_g1~~TRINITY_DN15020_c1_g1_i1.p1  ORF type:complete len:298 (+),score=49.87 TRINITY_DN15020_c1_g1_i1:82-975(+)
MLRGLVLLVGLAVLDATPELCNEESCEGLSLLQRQVQVDIAAEGRLLTWQEKMAQHGDLFSGCTSIFVDVGANRGTHVRKLFEPEKYPDAPYLKIFDNSFGPASKRARHHNETGLCAFGFEANPRWVSTLQGIEDAYARKGWRVQFFAPVAVSDHDGSVEFAINDLGLNDDWGAGVVKTADNATTIQVQAQDFAAFVQEIKRAAVPGFKLVKMDIESSEYIVVPELLEQELLCQPVLDVVTIEWHGRRFLPDGVDKASASDIENSVMQPSRRCLPEAETKFLKFDDESYVDDGMPLP